MIASFRAIMIGWMKGWYTGRTRRTSERVAGNPTPVFQSLSTSFFSFIQLFFSTWLCSVISPTGWMNWCFVESMVEWLFHLSHELAVLWIRASSCLHRVTGFVIISVVKDTTFHLSSQPINRPQFLLFRVIYNDYYYDWEVTAN